METVKEIRTRGEIKRGWWIEKRATVTCALDKEGLIVAFFRRDVEALMDSLYPHAMRGTQKIWWFNETRDREIAETDEYDRIIANPQVLLRHFMQKSKLQQ